MKWREIGGSEVEIGYEVTWRLVMKWREIGYEVAGDWL